jgi:hypothetical protein
LQARFGNAQDRMTESELLVRVTNASMVPKRASNQHNRGRLAMAALLGGLMVGLYGRRASMKRRRGRATAGAGLPGKWRWGGQIRMRLGRWVEGSVLLLSTQVHCYGATWVAGSLCGAVCHRCRRAWFCCHLWCGQLRMGAPSRACRSGLPPACGSAFTAQS